ncbi:retrovirus-related Pol polyprotein from transposon opus [Trichonephila clavipes]|nr:retrovirus-related Pol polyprotein from transposon opus [Trichonephila clavipes]
MSEKALVDHIFIRLEPQVQDYVEVRNPENMVQLLEVLAKFEERYSCKAIRGSRNSDNVEGHGWNERRMSSVDNNRGNWRNSEVVRRQSNGRIDYRGNYENSHQGNQWFESRNRFQKDDRRFNDRGYQFRNGSQKDDFSTGDHRNRGSSEKFSRGDRRQRVECFENKPGLTHVLYHAIDTGDNPPVVSRPYRYDRVKQEILDYHVDKMLKEGFIIPIHPSTRHQLCYVEKIMGYRHINWKRIDLLSIIGNLMQLQSTCYPLPLIHDLIMNIPHTAIMSALDLRLEYFQLAVNPSDIVKTAFVTKNGTCAFHRMSFGLSGAAPNTNKDNKRTNKDKCKFGCDELKYLGLIINKEGIKTDETKVRAIVEMKPPRNSKEVSKFLGMSQWYAKFIKNYADLCEPLYNLKRKLKKFCWSIEAQKTFNAFKAAISKAPILKLPDFKKPFALFTDASSIRVADQ